MTLEQFMDEALSPWMREIGPENDIVLSTRIRLARNFANEIFPVIADEEQQLKVNNFFYEKYNKRSFRNYGTFELIDINDLTHIEKNVLVEKNLIIPYLEKAVAEATLVSEMDKVSFMINENINNRM